MEQKRTSIVLNSYNLPVFLRSPAMRSDTVKDVFTPQGSPSALTQFLKQLFRVLLSRVLFHHLLYHSIPMGNFGSAPN